MILKSVMDEAGLRWRRSAAQGLAEPILGSVGDVVRRLLAVQAQEPMAYPLAIRARSTGLTAADVTAALEAREVVRCWGPRGTLHLVAVEDVNWLLPLVRTSPAGSMRRLRELGVETELDEAVQRTERALADQGPLSKLELGERLGLEGQAVVHLAMLAAGAGSVVLGPERSGKATYVHAGDWLGEPLPVTPPEGAVEELVVRYLRAHAPAGPDDLAAWSGIGKVALPAHAGFQGPADVPATGGPQVATAVLDQLPVRLIPAYDEYLLGWRDRSFAVPEPYRRRIHPGGGTVKAAVLVDGRARGTWRAPRTGIELEAFEPLPDLTEELEDLRRFRG